MCPAVTGLKRVLDVTRCLSAEKAGSTFLLGRLGRLMATDRISRVRSFLMGDIRFGFHLRQTVDEQFGLVGSIVRGAAEDFVRLGVCPKWNRRPRRFGGTRQIAASDKPIDEERMLHRWSMLPCVVHPRVVTQRTMKPSKSKRVRLVVCSEN